MSAVQALDVDQYSQQLHDRERWVRVVQLNGHLLRQLTPIDRLPPLKPPQQILNACGHQQVLLLQSQLFASVSIIVRVKHRSDVLGALSLFQCLSWKIYLFM